MMTHPTNLWLHRACVGLSLAGLFASAAAWCGLKTYEQLQPFDSKGGFVTAGWFCGSRSLAISIDGAGVWLERNHSPYPGDSPRERDGWVLNTHDRPPDLACGFGRDPFTFTHRFSRAGLRFDAGQWGWGDGPRRPYLRIDVPHWMIIVVTSIAPLLVTFRSLHRRHYVEAGHCPRCGYDLRATPERCPECGTRFDEPAVVAPAHASL
jgi:hypothetical protein